MPYAFVSPVLRLETGLKQHYLPLPPDIADELWDAGVRRLECTFNGHPIRRAIQGRRDGERYVMLNNALLREIGATLGDLVEVSLRPDPEPDRIDLGEEFTAVLEDDDEAAARFYVMTPGRQRSLASYVTSAKRTETRLKRALEMARKLRTHTLHGDLNDGE